MFHEALARGERVRESERGGGGERERERGRGEKEREREKEAEKEIATETETATDPETETSLKDIFPGGFGEAAQQVFQPQYISTETLSVPKISLGWGGFQRHLSGLQKGIQLLVGGSS